MKRAQHYEYHLEKADILGDYAASLPDVAVKCAQRKVEQANKHKHDELIQPKGK